MKEIKLTDKELTKLILILTSTKVKYLWIEGKIKLTNSQLELLINWSKEHEEN